MASSVDAVTYRARWVFPVAGEPLAKGTITVRGERIEAVEPNGRRSPDADLGNVAILPGLVNAHTHLDLSGARGLIPPTDPEHFTDWLRGVIAYRRTRTAEQVQRDIEVGLAECLRYGTTLAGDISANGDSWNVLHAAKLRAVVFREMIGLSRERADAARGAAQEWHDRTAESRTCRKGYSPHAPYSAHRELFNSGGSADTFATHLAESPAELTLLDAHTGPFVEFLTALGVWDSSGLVRLDSLLDRSRVVGTYLFAHANYLPVELCRDIAGSHSIVYCPRTHAAFGHPPHPFREFLARGVRVCLGTDSLASNPDLDLLAEAQFIHQHVPDFDGGALLKMATLSGAEALGWASETGSLEPGKSADVVVVPLADRDLPTAYDVLFDPASIAAPRRTLFQGQWREPGVDRPK